MTCLSRGHNVEYTLVQAGDVPEGITVTYYTDVRSTTVTTSNGAFVYRGGVQTLEAST